MFQLYTVLPIHKILFIDVAKCHTMLVWHFCYNVHVFYIYIYTTISLILRFVYVFICGGHHDSDRIAVLMMVSKAESIVSIILVKKKKKKLFFFFCTSHTD